MRLGLLGDVHAEDALLRIALDSLKAQRVDGVLCTGDLVDGHGDVDRACAQLREVSAMVVRGNHDRWIRADDMRTLPHAHRMTALAVETIEMLKGLPKTISLGLPRLGSHGPGRLVLCHGVGEDDMARLGPDDHGYAISSNEHLLALLFDVTVHVMVGGHTHRPMLRRFERGPGKPPLFVVNAGTLAREDQPGFVVLDTDEPCARFHVIEPDGSVALRSTAILR